MSSIFCVDRLKIVFFVFVVINLLFKWSIQWSFNDTDPVLRIRLNLIWNQIRTGKEDFVTGKSRPGSNWKMYKNKIM